MSETTLEDVHKLAEELRGEIGHDELDDLATIVFLQNVAEDYRADRAREKGADAATCFVVTDPAGSLTTIGDHPQATELVGDVRMPPETVQNSRGRMDVLLTLIASKVGLDLAGIYPDAWIIAVSRHVRLAVKVDSRTLSEEDVEESRLLYGPDCPDKVGDLQCAIVVTFRIKVLPDLGQKSS